MLPIPPFKPSGFLLLMMQPRLVEPKASDQTVPRLSTSNRTRKKHDQSPKFTHQVNSLTQIFKCSPNPISLASHGEMSAVLVQWYRDVSKLRATNCFCPTNKQFSGTGAGWMDQAVVGIPTKVRIHEHVMFAHFEKDGSYFWRTLSQYRFLRPKQGYHAILLSLLLCCFEGMQQKHWQQCNARYSCISWLWNFPTKAVNRSWGASLNN